MISPATIREARVEDIPAILGLVRDLADFERDPGSAVGTVESYAACLFPALPATPTVWAFVAEVDGGVVGMAVWFLTFSTWTGRNGVWLEDLYVRPQHRGGGIATALLARLAATAVERGYPRVEWTCLDWNTEALRLYAHLGAAPLVDWTTQRLAGAALAALAGR